MVFSLPPSTLSLDLDGCLYPYSFFVYDTEPDVEVGQAPPDFQNITRRSGLSAHPQGPVAFTPASAAESAPASAAGSTSAASRSGRRFHDPPSLIAGRLASHSDRSCITSQGTFQGVNHRLIDIFVPNPVSTLFSMLFKS